MSRNTRYAVNEGFGLAVFFGIVVVGLMIFFGIDINTMLNELGKLAVLLS